jgi:hypothetical protein
MPDIRENFPQIADKVMSSRCQSYTTLPRPEHAGEMFEEIVPFSTSQPAQIIYGNAGGGGMVPPLPGAQFRPSSAASRSLGRKNSTALPVAPLPPAYFGRPTIFDRHLGTEFDGNEYGEGGQLKEIVPWSTISLSSWLTVCAKGNLAMGNYKQEASGTGNMSIVNMR